MLSGCERGMMEVVTHQPGESDMTEKPENMNYEEPSIEETFETLKWEAPFPLPVSTWEAGQPVISLPVVGSITIQVTGSTNSVP